MFPMKKKLTHIDSLPHYQYKLIDDSLQKIAKIVKDRNTLSVFSRISTGFIGALKTSSYWYDWYGDQKSHLDPNYYISIPDYDINPQYQFEYRDHKNFLVKNQSDTSEIKVAYLPRTKTVLIPVSESAYTITRNCLFILMAIFTLAALYIGIGLRSVSSSIFPAGVFLPGRISAIFTYSLMEPLAICWFSW
jgi:hypothetical protein